MSLSEQREMAELRRRVTELEQKFRPSPQLVEAIARAKPGEAFVVFSDLDDVRKDRHEWRTDEIAPTPKSVVGMANPAEPYQDGRGLWRMKGKQGSFRSREAVLAR